MKHAFDSNEFRSAILVRYPRIPESVLNSIVDREAGRSLNNNLTPASYIPLAIASVAGYIRHRLTEYDKLLSHSFRATARDKVRHKVNTVITEWSGQ